MESWLPWLTAEEHLLPDLLPPSALVALVEPRRLRDRAQELLEALTATGKPVVLVLANGSALAVILTGLVLFTVAA